MINAGRMLVGKESQMKRVRTSKASLSAAIRWSARIVGSLLAALVLLLVVGHAFSPEGLPNPFTQPPGVAIELFGLLLTWVGLLVAWKWEGAGGGMIITGQLVFHITEGRFWLSTMGELFDLVGILFLLSWWLRKRHGARSVEDQRRHEEYISGKED
jgi:hypothetical protein